MNLEEEIWKPVSFEYEDLMVTTYEVSNLGRLRSFGKDFQGRIVKGGLTDGFKCLRLRVYLPQSLEVQQQLAAIREEISYFREKRRRLKKEKADLLSIRRATESIDKREKKWTKMNEKDKKKRITYPSILFHHLVAKSFLPEPVGKQVIIGHLDYDKLNNRADNLKWMTREEHTKHINQSPKVLAAKERRRLGLVAPRDKGHKLDSTQVLHIKKLLKKGWTQKKIAKNFGITDMQVSRIKRGENWGHVKLQEDRTIWDEMRDEMIKRKETPNT